MNNDNTELDDILAGYTTPAVVATPGGDVRPALPVDMPTEVIPGENKTRTYGAGPLPFISHDPTLAPAPEYYKRGAKKGQLKPPGKGKAPALNPAGQLSIQATTLMTGAVFITMIDLLMPLAITLLFNWMQSRKKTGVEMDYETMKMKPSQKADLAIVADAVVRELKVSGSPMLLFFVGISGVYFMNFMVQKSLAEKDAKQKHDEKVKEQTNKIPPVKSYRENGNDGGNY